MVFRFMNYKNAYRAMFVCKAWEIPGNERFIEDLSLSGSTFRNVVAIQKGRLNLY
jgi:hypothetical protein